MPDPTQTILYDEYTATCHCNRPDVQTKETIKCSSCPALTHLKCIKDTADNKYDIICGDYKCAPCKIDIDGVVWADGKGAKNTCPVDNEITHFALRASKDKNFKEQIEMMKESGEPAVKAFGNSVCHAVNNDSAKSHTAWLEVLKNAPDGLNSVGSWFGGTDEKFYDHLNKPLATFIQKLKTPCRDECTLTKKITKPRETHETTINLTTSPVEYFENTTGVFADTVEDCHQSGFGGSCKGRVTYGPMEIQVKMGLFANCPIFGQF